MWLLDDLDLQSTTDRCRALAALCDRISSAGSKNALIDAVDDALAVRAPVGSIETLEALARTYRGQVDDVARLSKRISAVARKGLPQVWLGTTSVLASEVVQAATRDADRIEDAFTNGAKALLRLADSLGDARKLDDEGRATLHRALAIVGPRDDFFRNAVEGVREGDDEKTARLRARSVASTGVGMLHAAAVTADDAARATARDLDHWASQARAGKLATDDITAADRLMLADTGTGDGDRNLNGILSANDMERAGRRMEKLGPQDEATLEGLLAGATSPQERAYLMKAFAAGHSIKDLQTFDGKIHAKDPEWLRQHLSPVVTRLDGVGVKTEVDFHGQDWAQGGDGHESTCVASSTVTARAMSDPLYALNLTGGPSGQENDPAAFRKRLIAEQHRLHEEGHGGAGWNGMSNEGQQQIANSTIGPATGSDYVQKNLDGPDTRRDLLPDIEAAVDEGRPVPVDVHGAARQGHAMMIIGQQGDKLEIYNPWGTTSWVSEDDFVNGHMDSASDYRLPNATTVFLPT